MSNGTDTETLPRPSDRFPRPRRVGCLLGCEGFGHEPDCPIAERPVPSGGCSLDYLCKTKGIGVLSSGPSMCPCDGAA